MARILGLIGARGGSKSIPRKNVRNFCGKPLIEWAIKSGLESGVLDRLIVSTDDEEIAAVAKKAGAEIPFMRPKELAEDTTPALAYILHAVTWLSDHERYVPDYVMLLEATSPGRQVFHITDAVELMERTHCDSVLGLGSVPGHFNYHWQVTVDEEKKASLVPGTAWPDVIRRRQDLPQSYTRNGIMYLFKTSLLFGENPNFYGTDVRGMPVDDKFSLDLDTPDDWERAERLFPKLL